MTPQEKMELRRTMIQEAKEDDAQKGLLWDRDWEGWAEWEIWELGRVLGGVHLSIHNIPDTYGNYPWYQPGDLVLVLPDARLQKPRQDRPGALYRMVWLPAHPERGQATGCMDSINPDAIEIIC